MKTSNEIYELALEYIDFCAGDISTNSYKIWVIDKDCHEADKHRIFLTALGLSNPI